MADLGEENKVAGVFGGVELVKENNIEENNAENVGTIFKTNLPAKQGLWSKFKAFWLQEVKVELTPHQQKIEDEINEFLHQEITWEKVHDFLFQEIKFGKKD